MQKNNVKNSKLKKKHRKISQSIESKKVESELQKNIFVNFAKKTSEIIGNAWTFIFALSIIIIWLLSGHYFKYSDTWQLVINTGTSIITFLIVFLIQNTQNRDTAILNLKLDELIIAKKGARNHIINLNTLSDADLAKLEKEYVRLCNKITGE